MTLTPFILAQLPTPSYAEIGLLLCGLTTLAIIYKHLREFKSSVVGDIKRELTAEGVAATSARLPQPFIVAPKESFASEEAVAAISAQIIPRAQLIADFARIDSEMKELRQLIAHGSEHVGTRLDDIAKQIGASFASLDHKRSVSIGNLHTHLTSAKERVAAMESSFTALSQQLHALDAKREADRNRKS